jgi:hypothetical protein
MRARPALGVIAKVQPADQRGAVGVGSLQNVEQF